MDPFTERILERARERQKKLLQNKDVAAVTALGESNSVSVASLRESKGVNMTTTVSDSVLCTKGLPDNNLGTETKSEGNLVTMVRQNSKTRISSNITGSPQSPMKTFNIQKENFNMEIKLSSTENVRVEVEFQDENEEGKENIQNGDVSNNNQVGLRDDAKMRLQRLGKLYAGGDDANISSPIHRTEATFLAEEIPSKKYQKKDAGRIGKGLGALSTLAQDINQWEDNLSDAKVTTDKQSAKKKSWKAPAPRPPISSARTSGEKKTQNEDTKTQVNGVNSSKICSNEDKPKQLNLDPTLVETLESQGFTRTVSNSHLVYNYKKQASQETKSAEIRSPSKMKELISKTCIIEEVEEIDKGKKLDGAPFKCNLKRIIANKAALFEANSNSSPNRSNKDPALLSLSERKALFEKNKGDVLIPKAPISMAAPVKGVQNVPKPVSPVKAVEKKSPPKYLAPRPPIRKMDTTDSTAFRVAPSESGGIASKVAALFKNKSTISQQQIQNEIKEQRQKEMDILLHRFHKNKAIVDISPTVQKAESESDDDDPSETAAMISKRVAEIVKTDGKTPSPPPLPPPSSSRKSGGKRCSLEDSPKVAATLEDVKRIKVSPAKPGKLYPCLSDIEAVTETETEMNTASTSPNYSSYEACSDSDGEPADTSFGRDVLETVCKNQSPPKRSIYLDSTESDMSDILTDMDDYLDEALAYDASNGPTPPKHRRSRSPIDNASHSSSSFQYKNCTPSKPTKPTTPYQTPIKEPSPIKNESPAYVVDGDDVLPLTHTVSFYRKQQTQGSKTPIRQVIKYPAIHESSDDSSFKEEDGEVQSKISSLMDEVTKQQTIISQTSQALNLCYSTPEFTGSTEQVEAEKVLLLATHRRSAAQREIERLSILKTLHSDNKFTENIPLEKGKLVISNIVLPLKRDYVRALNATGGKGHHVVCLIKCADQVYSTQLVSTVATNDRNPNLELNIPGTIHFKDIYSNFTAQFEVYCLQAQNESLPHDVKYHINKKGGHKITPKKGKAESRLIRPPKESPGGPQAVRSPTFALMGYVVFSIQAVKRKNWTLNNAPSMSPLEGIVEMRVKCELTTTVEHHGFLTMFEDVSGFGAWHRRWCMLKEHSLSYWKYPDDEKKKPPIDTLDLSTCITTQVGPVRRDICARLNTFLIETKRPAQPHDVDSLVMQCNGDSTIIRHLLSADTKEERNEWCVAFNKALTAANMLRG